MGVYVCENCNCIENTALGFYWSRNMKGAPEKYKGKALCSECGPPFYSDGSVSKYGKWHGQFEKQTLEEYLKDWPSSGLMNYPLKTTK